MVISGRHFGSHFGFKPSNGHTGVNPGGWGFSILDFGLGSYGERVAGGRGRVSEYKYSLFCTESMF